MLYFQNASLETPLHIFDAIGCSDCAGTGYLGRIPLIEVIEVDDALRERIRLGTVDDKTVGCAADSLAGHGLMLVGAGQTSFDELMRAVTIL